jgi:hypothetical protein
MEADSHSGICMFGAAISGQSAFFLSDVLRLQTQKESPRMQQHPAGAFSAGIQNATWTNVSVSAVCRPAESLELLCPKGKVTFTMHMHSIASYPPS